MKINKRTVAREGLIIIAILLLLGATFIISAEVKQFSDEEKVQLEKESTLEASKENYDKKYDFLRRSIMSIYQDKMTEKTDRIDRITNNIYIFLIAFYPVYWVIRFVVWSIKTLRTKS